MLSSRSAKIFAITKMRWGIELNLLLTLIPSHPDRHTVWTAVRTLQKRPVLLVPAAFNRKRYHRTRGPALLRSFCPASAPSPAADAAVQPSGLQPRL